MLLLNLCEREQIAFMPPILFQFCCLGQQKITEIPPEGFDWGALALNVNTRPML